MYKVYRIFNETMSYFMVSKVKPNICLNLLYCYYTKYENGGKNPEEYKNYFKVFENDEDFDIEEKGSYDNRDLAKQALKDFISQCDNCITMEKPIEEIKPEKIKAIKPIKPNKPIKSEKQNKTSNISQYNKTKYMENKEHFKQYYESNKEKIRTYQKLRYQEMKEKLRELEELKTK